MGWVKKWLDQYTISISGQSLEQQHCVSALNTCSCHTQQLAISDAFKSFKDDNESMLDKCQKLAAHLKRADSSRKLLHTECALASAIPCRLLISYMMFISCTKTNGVLWLIPARNFSSSLWVRATPPSGISPLRQGRSIPDGGADFFIRNFISRSTENIIWIPDGGAKWPFSFVFY